MADVVIIDSGGANLASLRFALTRLGASAEVSVETDRIRRASHVLLPGVGAAHDTMARLRQHGLDQLIPTLRQPVLGICLGMQLLTRGSEEGTLPGLGWIAADCKRFTRDRDPSGKMKVPHMGWNVAYPTTREGGLFDQMEGESRFYFVHSYHAVCDDPADVAATTQYYGPFVSSVRRGNVYGAQFHPEKSHRFGMRVLENFAKVVA